MLTTPKTLAQVRQRLRARLGYAAVADTSGPMQDLLNDFIVSAHDMLFPLYEWPELRRDWLFTCTPGQAVYPIPTDSDGRTPDIGRAIDVYVQVNQIWSPLVRGIMPGLYTIISTGIPLRWEVAHGNPTVPPGTDPDAATLELWQTPSDAYTIRFRAYALSNVFATDNDASQVEGELLFLQALALAKAHYGQPDAKSYQDMTSSRLRKLRSRSHAGNRYTAEPEWTPPPQPKIKGLDVP